MKKYKVILITGEVLEVERSRWDSLMDGASINCRVKAGEEGMNLPVGGKISIPRASVKLMVQIK